METGNATLLQVYEPGFFYRPPELVENGGGTRRTSERRLRDLTGFFSDESAFVDADPNTLVYSVEAFFPVEEGTEGGLFFGISHIEAGRIGNEYFMTKGHFHQETNRAEFYWGLEGSGALIFMDADRRSWAEWVRPGSLHYVPGGVAHRLANCGSDRLSVGACWPSDAGHDYDSISEAGFSGRLVEVDGEPRLVSTEELEDGESR